MLKSVSKIVLAALLFSSPSALALGTFDADAAGNRIAAAPVAQGSPFQKLLVSLGVATEESIQQAQIARRLLTEAVVEDDATAAPAKSKSKKGNKGRKTGRKPSHGKGQGDKRKQIKHRQNVADQKRKCAKKKKEAAELEQEVAELEEEIANIEADIAADELEELNEAEGESSNEGGEFWLEEVGSKPYDEEAETAAAEARLGGGFTRERRRLLTLADADADAGASTDAEAGQESGGGKSKKKKSKKNKDKKEKLASKKEKRKEKKKQAAKANAELAAAEAELAELEGGDRGNKMTKEEWEALSEEEKAAIKAEREAMRGEKTANK